MEINEKNGKLPAVIEKSILAIVNKEGYTNYAIDKKLLAPDGLLGEVYVVDIKDENHTKQTNLFLKRQLSGKQLDSYFHLTTAYKRELYFYEELLKIYEEFEDQANIPPEERYKTVKYYEESNPDVIILENQVKKGFEPGRRMEVMSLKYVELAAEQLARFHGLSFVLEKFRPDYFNENIKPLEPPVDYNDTWNAAIKNFVSIALKELSGSYRDKVINYELRAIESLPKYWSGKGSAINCLQHGDFKHNNLLRKVVDEETVEVIPVDYQLMHYGCLVDDLLFLLYTGTDRKFRNKHLEHIKNLYYDTLRRFLARFEINVEDIVTEEDFHHLYNERIEYGLTICVTFFSIMFVPEDKVPNLGTDDITSQKFDLDERYEYRIKDTIDEFVELGYI